MGENWLRRDRTPSKGMAVAMVAMALVGFGISGLSGAWAATATLTKSVESALGPTVAGSHMPSAVVPHALAHPADARFGPNLAAAKPITTGLNGVSFNPGCSSSPCPMGITDYGETPSLTGYTYSPHVVESFYDIDALGVGVANGGGCLDPDAASEECFTLQENMVTHATYVENTKGSYWVQNVPEVAYDSSCSSPCVSSTWSVTWLDNIWNFSYSGGICPSGVNAGKGCINPATIVGNAAGACSSTGGAPEFYYCVGPTVYDLTPPFTIWAWTDVDGSGPCTTSNTQTCINFYGAVYNQAGWLYGHYYDGVAMASGSGGRGAPSFYVHDGNAPFGLPYDFEWVAGGPGGGSDNTVYIVGDMSSYYALSNAAASLLPIKHAFSSGYDTAEAVYDLQVSSVPGAGNYRSTATTYFAADNPAVNLW
jgi:Thermopsin